jgi:hypothetical protein
MTEVHLTGKPLEQRISDRLKPSCGGDYDVEVVKGDGPTRCVTAIRNSRNQQWGEGDVGVDINGNRRGVV